MLPPDQLCLIGCLLSAIPLSYTMTLIKNPRLLLLFTCSCSIVMQIFVFGWWALLLWLQQLVVYFLCRCCPRDRIGKIVLVQTFAALLGIQLARMYLSYGVESVDITAIFMMQVFQYVSFSFNYQDGANNDSNAHYAIYQLPTFFEYMGFVLFVPSCLVGPVFQFRDYQAYLYRNGPFQNMKAGFGWPGMVKQLKTTFFSVALFALLLPFPLSFTLTQQFSNTGFLMQSVYILVAIMGARFKYYTAWSLGMVAMHATGFTYNPKINSHGKSMNNWDRVVVSNIWDFEMDPSMKKKADAWNIPIQLALKRYIYDRLYTPSEEDSPREKKMKQISAQQKTLAISALWHGLYPGYFIAFFHWALILQISQQLFRLQKESSKLRKWRKKFHYLQVLLINYFLGYFGVAFQMMTFNKIHTFFSATHYVPIIITYMANIVIVRLGLFSTKKKRKTQKITEMRQKSM